MKKTYMLKLYTENCRLFSRHDTHCIPNETKHCIIYHILPECDQFSKFYRWKNCENRSHFDKDM